MAWLLSLIVLVSAFLRVPLLNQVPPELFGDELDVGYQAFSLLKTGRDLYRQPLPFYIHSLSEWRAPLLMYATVPTVAIFGLNDWGVRLPSAVLGSLAPVILFLLVIKIGHCLSADQAGKLKIGYLASLGLALMPWHIHYSRAAFEVVLLLNLFMLGTLLFLKKRFDLCLLTFALAMYTYSIAVFFVPVWLVVLVWQIKKLPTVRSLLLFTVTVTPLIYYVVLGPARARFGLVGVAADGKIADTISYLRQENSSKLYEKLFHNWYETIFGQVIHNYLSSFSTEFLFIRGDPAFRHSIQVVGEIWPVWFILWALGLVAMVRHKQWLWLTYLVLAPIPAALTAGGGYHATRLFLVTAPMAVAVGYGWYTLRRWRWLTAGMVLLTVWQAVSAGHYYLVHYPKQSWQWWHYGYRQTMYQANNLAANYSRVFINNTYEPALLRFLFWTGFSPLKFQRDFKLDQNVDNIVPGYNGFDLGGRYFFGDFSDLAKKEGLAKYMLPNALYVLSARDNGDGHMGTRTLATINNPYDKPLFYLVVKQ